MTKILLLGSSGMLGRAFKKMLTKKNIDYAAPSSKEVDIRKKESISHVCQNKKFSHCINCSAYTAVDMAQTNPEDAFAVNAQGVKNIAEVALDQNIKVVHYSTDYVFNGEKRQPYTEEDTTFPLSVYGLSKLMGEFFLLKAIPTSLIIRISWLFGDGDHNFVLAMLKRMQEEESLKLVSDQIGKPTYCYDLIEATFNLLPFDGIFHFSNKCETSWYDYATEILKIAKEEGFYLKCEQILPISRELDKRAAKRPAYSVLDTTKYETVTKKPIRGWEEGVKIYLQELKKR